MKGIGRALIKGFKNIDPILFGATSFLSVVSLLTIFGAMDNFGKSKLVMQIAMTVLGFIMLYVIANLDYKFMVERFFVIFFAVSVILLIKLCLQGIFRLSWVTICLLQF